MSRANPKPARPVRGARGSRRASTPGYTRASIRIDQVQQLLEDMLSWTYPADAVLSRWMRANRNAGARDRAEVADAAFDVLRHLRRYRQLAESGTGPATRRLAILGLASVTEPAWLQAALSPDEQAWLAHTRAVPATAMPRAIRYSLPGWLDESLGQLPDAEGLMAALNTPAPLDLRVNIMKTTRDDVLLQLRNSLAAGFDPQPTPYSPWGIRIQGRPPVNQWPQFKDGQLEVQDEGSQILGALVAPRRGEMVIDYCAGAGGKTLLLGALMRSTGRLYAFDVHAARLAKAKPRFARSGLSNIVPVVISEEGDKRVKRLHGKAHRVLVDAPCTGVGTLRRNPDLKWRMSPEAVDQLVQTQASILQQASRCVAPGGRLVYATCSLLPEENEQQIERFLAANTHFKRVDAGTVLADRIANLDASGPYLKLRPDHHNTDGFFAAVMVRQ